MKQPKISVILPVYNTKVYVSACLDSVLTQTFEDFEIIIIDDASKDGSTDIVTRYSIYDSRVKYYRNVTNKGLAFSRNRGLDLANGKYVLFVDSDDLLVKDALSELYSAIEKMDADVLFFNASRINQDDEMIEDNVVRLFEKLENSIDGFSLFNKFVSNNCRFYMSWLALYKREFIEDKRLRFINYIIHEDLYFAYKVLINSKRTFYTSKVYYLWRKREGSITSQQSQYENLYGYLKTYMEIYSDFLKGFDDEFQESVIEMYLNNIRKGMKSFNDELIKVNNKRLSKAEQYAYLDAISSKKIKNNRILINPKEFSGRKIYIWGAGYFGKKFFEEHPDMVISGFIDSNVNRKEEVYCGKKIISPNDILCYSDVFIIVAVFQNNAILSILQEKGLKHGIDYALYDEIIEPISVSDMERDIECFEKRVAKNEEYKNKCLFFSHFIYAHEKRQMIDFINQHNRNKQIVILCDAITAPDSTILEQLDCEFEMMPMLFRNFGKVIDAIRGAEIKGIDFEHISQKEYLLWTYKNLLLMYPDAETSVCAWVVLLAECLVDNILKELDPSCVMIFNSFRSWHYIIEGIAKEKNIKIYYFEFGPIEGTFQIDGCGLMGESYPCIKASEFDKLYIDASDLIQAKQIIKYMYESRINRYMQKQINIQKTVDEYFMNGEPLVVFMGQNDFEAGLQPYTIRTIRHHSGFYMESKKAAEEIYEICRRKNYNFIYKPHPAMKNLKNNLKDINDEIFMLNDGDINDIIDRADVVITINSSVAYISMIRGKPTILLGKMQLSNHGCCYECSDLYQLPGLIDKALNNGLDKVMLTRFEEHIARMMRYYSYDTMITREMPYGRRDNDLFDQMIKNNYTR